MGMLHGTRRALLGGGKRHILKADLSLMDFTESMAIRAGTVFEGAPIVQGKFDGTGTPDSLTLARGSLVGDASALFYDNFDSNQGTFVYWWTPEKDRDAAVTMEEYLWRVGTEYWLRYEHNNQRLLVNCGGQWNAYTLASVAGTTYCVIISWDCKKTIDGTNYNRISVGDVHSYGATTQPTASEPYIALTIGSSFGASRPANALIEGLHILRRVLWDGAYGTDVNGGIDEVALISAGADPCAIAGGGGSWDCTFGLPTDSTPAALVTGEGHAWSHPHDSEIELDAFLDDEYAGGNWVDEGTPLTPTEISFDGADTSVVVPDAAEIQDLHAGEMTAEAWISPDGWGEGNSGRLFDKTAAGAEGYRLATSIVGGILAQVHCVTTAALAYSGTDEFSPDSQWHHIAMQFDGTALPAGNPVIYLWIDGVPVASYATHTAGVGAAITDVGNDLYLGNRSDGASTFDGRLGGWARLSDSLRYTAGEAFVPNARMNPPNPADGNTVWQTDYSDGAGAVLTDDSGGGNDGAITDGAGGWLVTHDMATDAPGARMYHGGYVFGNDAVDEGFQQTIAGLAAGSNYVFRVPVHWGADSRGQPEIVVYDETNGAAITTFLGPKMVATHDGGDDSATFIDADGNFKQSQVGMTLYNITDGSKTVVTAVSGDGTTATGVLAGGTDNNWDDGDVGRFVWADGFSTHPWCETFTCELPTIARDGVGADCVSASVRCLNASDEGTLYWHQVEWLANLIDNPSMAVFTGANPDIPVGWTNNGLDAGDSEEENTIVHSGAASMQWNIGAVSFESIYQGIGTPGINKYYSMLLWGYGNGTAGCRLLDNSDRLDLQAGGNMNLNTGGASVWQTRQAVARTDAALALFPSAYATTTAGAARYLDDIAMIALNPVSLTATPRSEANSVELGGLSIDGRDTCTQPPGRLTRTHGEIRFSGNPRHDMDEVGEWGQPTYESLMEMFAGGGTNRFILRRRNTPQLELVLTSNGATLNAVWPTAWAAGEQWNFIVKWNPARFWVLVNGTERFSLAWLSPFTVDISPIWWGTHATGIRQFNGVILP